MFMLHLKNRKKKFIFARVFSFWELHGSTLAVKFLLQMKISWFQARFLSRVWLESGKCFKNISSVCKKIKLLLSSVWQFQQKITNLHSIFTAGKFSTESISNAPAWNKRKSRQKNQISFHYNQFYSNHSSLIEIHRQNLLHVFFSFCHADIEFCSLSCVSRITRHF